MHYAKNLGLHIVFHCVYASLGFNPKTLMNLDDIWSHYQMHQEEYGDDFLTFIDLHYGSGKAEHQDEHQEHEQLPCLNCNLLQTQIVLISVLEFNFIQIETPIDKNLNYLLQQ